VQRIRIEDLPARLLAAAKALPRHRALDRLIRGRAWIGLVAFALIGIVTLQLGLLQLNSGVGRALERETVLERENSSLSVENSSLSSPERVEALATHAGMRPAPESSLRFLARSDTGALARAARALVVPAGSAASTHSTSTAETQSQTPAQPAEGEGSAAASATAAGTGAGGSQETAATGSGAAAGTEGAPAATAPASSTQATGAGEAPAAPSETAPSASGGAPAGSPTTEGAG
jgi:cell division protein FtsL